MYTKLLAGLLGFAAVVAPTGQALADDPVLPPVEVTGTRFGWQVVCYGMACADFLASAQVDFNIQPDLVPLSGGDGEAADTPTKEDYEKNPNEAPCRSAPNDRLWHSAHVFHNWRKRKFGAMISRGRGQIINVTFSDGGSERYMWIPGSMPSHTSPIEIYLAPVPGTHKCD